MTKTISGQSYSLIAEDLARTDLEMVTFDGSMGNDLLPGGNGNDITDGGEVSDTMGGNGGQDVTEVNGLICTETVNVALVAMAGRMSPK
ncbi:MAG: hypothetical protein AAGB19_07035 [Cyanobacteria bacterium P01_F01_bin.3]